MGKLLMTNPNDLASNKQQKQSQKNKKCVILQSQDDYGTDDFTNVKEPTVSAKSIQIYKNYTQLPDMVYERSPSAADLDIIEKYLKCGR